MYVVPSARGRGVATALLAGLEDAARDRGWTTLRLETGPGSRTRSPSTRGRATGRSRRSAGTWTQPPRSPCSSSECSTAADVVAGPWSGPSSRTPAADADLAAVGAVCVPDGGSGVAGDGEAALVDGGVVPLAEQGAVLAAGGAAVGPVDDVVDVAPGGRGGAAGEHAVPVAVFHRPADGGGGGALFLADVQWKGGGVGEQPHHAGVAGQPAGGLGGDRAGEGQFAAGDAGGSAGGAEG